jgi:23S rRNA (uracil1939-C5)-methyltransferase
MQFPVGKSGGIVVAGCFAQGSHNIIDTNQCYIQHDLNNDIVKAVKEIVSQLGVSVYNERTSTGLIRHIMGRVGIKTGEAMVVLVTKERAIPQRDRLISMLRERIPGLVSIMQNINEKNTNIILGSETRTLWGQDSITDYLGPYRFKISARSFFQVNTVQAELLYEKAVEYAELSGRETVIDAYCGTGTITMFLASKAQHAYGIEVVPEAIEDARNNAVANGITNVTFKVGDAIEVMPEMYDQGIRPDVIVVDPPRAGCAQTVLDAFIKMQPQRIIYVSCNPSSLARDLAYLAEYQYKTKEITPVDMFPQTSHVECVVLLQRKHSTK